MPAGAALEEGRSVVLGIRPEDLAIAETGLAASIDLVEPTGAEIYVNATLGGKPMTAVFRERHDLHASETIHMSAREGRMHLFDPRTEARLN